MATDTITAIKKALERQTENMAFIINHVSMPEHWLDKFMRELDEDRQSIATLESLQRENEALRQDRYDLAYAITGGEDAPGLLDSVPTSQLVEIARDTHRSHSADIDRAEAAEAEVKRLREALDKIDDGYGANHMSTFCRFTASEALASTGGEHNAE